MVSTIAKFRRRTAFPEALSVRLKAHVESVVAEKPVTKLAIKDARRAVLLSEKAGIVASAFLRVIAGSDVGCIWAGTSDTESLEAVFEGFAASIPDWKAQRRDFNRYERLAKYAAARGFSAVHWFCARPGAYEEFLAAEAAGNA